MRHVIESLVGVLPIDPIARRALDETLADWRHELSVDRGPIPRLVAHVRNGVAVAGVLARTTFGGLGQRESWWLAGWVVLSASVCTMANVSVTESGIHAPTVMLDMFPMFALLACAVVPARSSARASWLGAAAIIGGLLFAYSGWLAPMLQHTQNERMRALLDLRLPEPNLFELPLPALADVALKAGWDSGLAVIRLNIMVAMAVLPLILVWLGLSAKRLCDAVQRPKLARPVALGCALAVFFFAQTLMRLAVPLGDSSTFARAAVQVVTFWSHVALALGEGTLMIWLAQPRTRARLRAWARS